jgi:osmotically inducible protein OsmC
LPPASAPNLLDDGGDRRIVAATGLADERQPGSKPTEFRPWTATRATKREIARSSVIATFKEGLMITRTGSARYDGLGKDGKGHVSTQSGVLRDTPYGFTSRFEDGAGTNPEELIAAAHASCFTMALSFALAKEGLTDGTLETIARVKLDKDGDGFKVSRSDLSLAATVPGIEEARFREIAEGAKAGCPISKLLNAEISLEISLG